MSYPRTAAASKLRRRYSFALESLDPRLLLAGDLAAVMPADNSLYVSPSTNLMLTFDEAVFPGAGNIQLRRSADDSLVETFDINDASRVTFAGATVTVDPSSELAADSAYYVQVDAGAIHFDTTTLFSEGFDALELLPFESSSESNGDDTDWTDQLPNGWSRDNTTTPEDGPIEFFGFSVFDKNSWIATAVNQDRSTFTRGTGNVVVADGDEYADLGDIGDDLFNVFLLSPEIPLTGAAANSVALEFDSSFRPYDTQTGLVDVTFDGGATWTNLLTLNSDTAGGDSSLSRANEAVSLEINNPANATVQVRFGMVDTGNDWWWAIDNVALKLTAGGDDVYSGLTDKTAWNFRTSPQLSPADDSVDADVNTNLSLTFSTEVVVTPALGNFTIYNAADDSILEVIPANSDRVTVSGNTVTIDPVSALTAGSSYYVQFDEFTVWDKQPVNLSGITLLAEDFDSLPLQDSVIVGNPDVDNYVVVMSGVLDVKVAGEYTFGIASDDGQRLAIDLDQNGLDILSADEILYDNTTHGVQVRLNTCGYDVAAQSCVDLGAEDAISLKVGQYPFQFWYFDAGGGSGGEFFYAPGYHEQFDPSAFVLVGDDSQGIGVTAEGITATMYQSTESVGNLLTAEDLVFDGINLAEGSPVSQSIPVADIFNTGNPGRFQANLPLPGAPPVVPGEDWSPDAPAGWSREVSPEGGLPEYNGWSMLNKDFWITQQGNQDRSTFTKGRNTLAVADPDAFDDFRGIEPDLLRAFMTTPEIPFSNLPAGGMSLEFDSSFRPYDAMTGLVDVSFDGGANWQNLLTLDTASIEGGNSSLVRANETVTLEVDNPVSGSVMFRWGMTDAGNDWWWAIDNIRVVSSFPGNPLPGIHDAGTWNFQASSGSEPLPGDIDGDGEVQFPDFVILANHFGSQVPAGTLGDLDGDGVVQFPDFVILANNFGRKLEPQAAGLVSGTAVASPALAIGLVDQAIAELEFEEDHLLSNWFA